MVLGINLRNYKKMNKIKPVNDKTFSLKQIQEAFSFLETLRVKGVIVIAI